MKHLNSLIKEVFKCQFQIIFSTKVFGSCKRVDKGELLKRLTLVLIDHLNQDVINTVRVQKLISKVIQKWFCVCLKAGFSVI